MTVPTRMYSALDLLDAVHAVLPADGYCVLGVTDEDIYEVSLDGTLRGRAFGGSRIAVFSTAAYARDLQRVASARTPAAERATGRASALAYQLATLAHETMHCYGLDHCGLFRCCMNSWSDVIQEFSTPPRAARASASRQPAAPKAGGKRGRGKRGRGTGKGAAVPPVRLEYAHGKGDVTGSLHLCPVCVRKLQHTCGFGLAERWAALGAFYAKAGLEDQRAWCAAACALSDGPGQAAAV